MTFLLREARREARGLLARSLPFVACLALGVGAVVAVAGVSEGVVAGLRAQSRELLAADVGLRSRRALPPAVEEAIAAEIARHAGARRMDVTVLASMAAAPGTAEQPGRSLLADVKAVSPGWPAYGRVETDPPDALARLDGHSAIVAPALLQRLGLRAGDELLLGSARLRIAGTVLSEPDHLLGSLAIGPRILIHREALDRAGLVMPGSRTQRTTLLALPGATPGTIGSVVGRLREAAGTARVHVESYLEAQPEYREDLERLDAWLGLVALLSLLVGGVGVAQAVRAFVAARLDAVAILRCLGARPREVVLLHLVLAAVLGAGGAGLGLALGAAAIAAIPGLVGDLLPVVDLPVLPLGAALRGLLLGIGVAVAFALPPILAVRAVPPLRALRRDVEPPAPGRLARWAAAAALLAATAAGAGVQSGSAVRALQFTAAIAVTAGVLVAGASVARRAIAASPAARRARAAWLRQGLAALGRSTTGVVGATVALGLGALTVLALALVQRGLSDQLRAELPKDAPSVFLLDVQVDQWDAIRSVLRDGGATRVDSVPMTMARLARVDGRSVEEIARALPDDDDGPDGDGGPSRWALTREQRLTWLERLPEGNRVVRGSLWSDPARAEVSVEEDFAEDLGVDVGSTLVVDVLGVPVELAVTSIRTVEWRTFGINFFLVVEPGVLDHAPRQVLATARLPKDREAAVQDALVAAAPNVTLIPIREVLDRVASLVERIAGAVRLIGLFAMAAGGTILAGAVAASASRRAREVALLRALGMTPREAALMLATEHALMGVVAALIGCAGALVVAWIALARGMELPFRPAPSLVALAALATVLIAVLAGLAASLPVLRARPIDALRAAAE